MTQNQVLNTRNNDDLLDYHQYGKTRSMDRPN